jgi:hypothetical protein
LYGTRYGAVRRLLWTQYCILRFHKMWGICWLAEWLPEVSCSVGLVSCWSNVCSVFKCTSSDYHVISVI